MQSNTKAYLALTFICLIWGTTFLAISSCVKTFPPLLFGASRQAPSGIILLLFVVIFLKKTTWSAANIKRQIIAGILMIGLGNGLVCWACQYIPSGLAALLCSTMPACVVFLNLMTEKGFRLNGAIILGILSGFLGMAAIFSENLNDLANPNYMMGMIATFVATVAWAYGGIYGTAKLGTHNSPFANAGIQLTAGGLFQLTWSALMEDWSTVPPLTSQVVWTLAYLIVFGSIFAFVAYLYAMSKLSAGLVSIYAYINPLVAVILGWWVLGEKLTAVTALAFLLVIGGIYGINKGYKLQVTKATNP